MSAYITTTIYEVIRKASAEALASKLFPDANCRSYVDEALKAMLSVNPNLESSIKDAIVIKDDAQIAELAGSTWSDALGRRVLMPACSSSGEWQNCAAVIFGHMCLA